MSRTILETPEEVESEKSTSVPQQFKRRPRPPNPFRVTDEKDAFQLKKSLNARINAGSSLVSLVPTSPGNVRYNPITKPRITSSELKTIDRSKMLPETYKNQETLSEFILQKREIFLAQLAINTKQEELQRLERLEREKQSEIESKEAEIELFKSQFAKFLETDGKVTMETRQSAQNKAMESNAVSNQIKEISTKINTLRQEIAHQEEKLEECQKYQKFLDSLTPPDWKKDHPGEMFFKDPQQLITIIQSLEEQNMFLIRHCQEAEETVERYRAKFNQLLESRDGEMMSMMQNKEEKKRELDKTKMKNEQYKAEGNFRYGNELNKNEYQDIEKEIRDFHASLGFDDASQKDIALMLRRIENKMEDLTLKLETIDPQTVKILAQEKERVRRDDKRSKEQEKKSMDQAEKVKKAIELANKPIDRKMGRPLIERIVVKKGQSRQEEEERAKREKIEKEADDQLLFGQIWD